MDDQTLITAARGEIDTARTALADLYQVLFGVPHETVDADRDGRIDLLEAAQDIRLLSQVIKNKVFAGEHAETLAALAPPAAAV